MDDACDACQQLLTAVDRFELVVLMGDEQHRRMGKYTADSPTKVLIWALKEVRNRMAVMRRCDRN